MPLVQPLSRSVVVLISRQGSDTLCSELKLLLLLSLSQFHFYLERTFKSFFYLIIKWQNFASATPTSLYPERMALFRRGIIKIENKEENFQWSWCQWKLLS
jgi:hypothetical protein